MSELPYKLESVLCSESSFLPSIGKNRRPAVQQIIEQFWRDEERTPGHEHWSMSGMTARVIATHLTLNNYPWVLRTQPGMGYFIRRAQ